MPRRLIEVITDYRAYILVLREINISLLQLQLISLDDSVYHKKRVYETISLTNYINEDQFHLEKNSARYRSEPELIPHQPKSWVVIIEQFPH